MAYPRDATVKSQFSNTETKEMHRLMECMCICRACAKKCIEEGNRRVALICLDCSEICDLAIKLKSSNSEYLQSIIDLCIQACRHCASECDRLVSSSGQECAEACRHCAESCALGSSYR